MDPISLIVGASGPVLVILWVLVMAAALSWAIIVIKGRQLRRWWSFDRELSRSLASVRDPEAMQTCVRSYPDALGARVVQDLLRVRTEVDLLEATAHASLADMRQRASTLMTFLASVGSVAPFVGLLGTVYGIMDAFLRIGREKSASLPVVAPAIGEALIVTAVGLFAAIPAVIGYNFLLRRIDGLTDHVEASSRVWIQLLRRTRTYRPG